MVAVYFFFESLKEAGDSYKKGIHTMESINRI